MGNADCISVGMFFSSQSKHISCLNLFHFNVFSVICCCNTEKEVKDINTTVFTSKINGEIFLKPNRPALVVSSTSWFVLLNYVVKIIVFVMLTACNFFIRYFKYEEDLIFFSTYCRTPDEDFSILLEAALMYDRRVAATLGEEDSMDEGQLWIDIKNGKQFVYPRLLFIITGIILSAILLGQPFFSQNTVFLTPISEEMGVNYSSFGIG